MLAAGRGYPLTLAAYKGDPPGGTKRRPDGRSSRTRRLEIHAVGGSSSRIRPNQDAAEAQRIEGSPSGRREEEGRTREYGGTLTPITFLFFSCIQVPWKLPLFIAAQHAASPSGVQVQVGIGVHVRYSSRRVLGCRHRHRLPRLHDVLVVHRRRPWLILAFMVREAAWGELSWRRTEGRTARGLMYRALGIERT